MEVASQKSISCAIAVEDEPMEIIDLTSDEEPDICIFKTHELLSKAQSLAKDIEELMKSCTLSAPPQRRSRLIRQASQARGVEDGGTLVIEGFRFESAASREDLRRPSKQAGAAGRHMTDG